MGDLGHTWAVGDAGYHRCMSEAGQTKVWQPVEQASDLAAFAAAIPKLTPRQIAAIEIPKLTPCQIAAIEIPKFTPCQIAAIEREREAYTARFAARVACRGGGSVRSIRRAAAAVDDLDEETAIWLVDHGLGRTLLVAALRSAGRRPTNRAQRRGAHNSPEPPPPAHPVELPRPDIACRVDALVAAAAAPPR